MLQPIPNLHSHSLTQYPSPLPTDIRILPNPHSSFPSTPHPNPCYIPAPKKKPAHKPPHTKNHRLVRPNPTSPLKPPSIPPSISNCQSSNTTSTTPPYPPQPLQIYIPAILLPLDPPPSHKPTPGNHHALTHTPAHQPHRKILPRHHQLTSSASPTCPSNSTFFVFSLLSTFSLAGYPKTPFLSHAKTARPSSTLYIHFLSLIKLFLLRQLHSYCVVFSLLEN